MVKAEWPNGFTCRKCGHQEWKAKGKSLVAVEVEINPETDAMGRTYLRKNRQSQHGGTIFFHSSPCR
ncbi:hypothetical protein ISS30_08010 [bacterium]|nr:hypothetical protein [FCB group bacterium]MBL7191628.1 hypothetical protein [bacterium]